MQTRASKRRKLEAGAEEAAAVPVAAELKLDDGSVGEKRKAADQALHAAAGDFNLLAERIDARNEPTVTMRAQRSFASYFLERYQTRDFDACRLIVANYHNWRAKWFEAIDLMLKPVVEAAALIIDRPPHVGSVIVSSRLQSLRAVTDYTLAAVEYDRNNSFTILSTELVAAKVAECKQKLDDYVAALPEHMREFPKSNQTQVGPFENYVYMMRALSHLNDQMELLSRIDGRIKPSDLTACGLPDLDVFGCAQLYNLRLEQLTYWGVSVVARSRFSDYGLPSDSSLTTLEERILEREAEEKKRVVVAAVIPVQPGADDSMSTCRCCSTHVANVALVPCGHMACSPCLKAWGEDKPCMTCRTPSTSKLTLFYC